MIKIRDEKFQHDTDRAVADISALSSGKRDRYEYLVNEEIWPSKKSTYSPFRKILEKQTQTQLKTMVKTN